MNVRYRIELSQAERDELTAMLAATRRSRIHALFGLLSALSNDRHIMASHKFAVISPFQGWVCNRAGACHLDRQGD
ncbi:hypothetical protein QA633_07365 [Bradyrhizobium barranii]|uniref:hypothetical protein n=1 Tax=Bradyrhizobium barranii TaxID=2992140 RepID=UPI0024B06CA0|nr:hypothetical protein [Bradyrhizobium barranii]WFT96891.1 hypothetical protein QA633_07365 [Bradyrhizobium barranii]